MRPGPLVLRSVATFVSLAGVAGALTWLFLGMRAVMAVGGSCGSGGPYVVARACPSGIPTVMLGGIFGGMVCLAVYALVGLPFGPRLTLLTWPALFLSLGYNFLVGGLAGSGAYMLCAVLFFLMGGVPLLALVNRGRLARTFAADPPATTADRFGALSAIGVMLPFGALRRSGPRDAAVASGWADQRDRTGLEDRAGDWAGHDGGAGRSIVASGHAGGQPDDLSYALGRLAALHSSGALSDEEFIAAKRRLLHVDHGGDVDENGERDNGTETR